MQSLCDNSVAAVIGRFVRETFVGNVMADEQGVDYIVDVHKPEWLLNDHFPGTSIVQGFFQGAMLLYAQNEPTFNPEERMFFLGGIRVKFVKPIFLGDRVKFVVTRTTFANGVLLFDARCTDAAGKAYARMSGSLATKSRLAVAQAKSQSQPSQAPALAQAGPADAVAL